MTAFIMITFKNTYRVFYQKLLNSNKSNITYDYIQKAVCFAYFILNKRLTKILVLQILFKFQRYCYLNFL